MKTNLKPTLAVLSLSLMVTVAFAQENNQSGGNMSPGMNENTVTPQHFVWEAGMTDLKEVHLSELALQKSDNPDVKAFAEHMVMAHKKDCKKLQGIAEREGLKFPDANSMSMQEDRQDNSAMNQNVETNGASTTMPEIPRGQGTMTNPVVINTSDSTSEGTNTMPEIPRGQGATTNPVVADIGGTASTDATGGPKNFKGQDSETNSTETNTTDGMNRPNDMQGHENLESLSGTEFDRAYAAKMVKAHEMAIHKFEMASAQLQDPELKKYADKTLPVLRSHLRMAEDLVTKVGADSGNGTTDNNMANHQ